MNVNVYICGYISSSVLGFRRELDYICAILGCYAVYSGISVPTFQDNLSGPIFKGPAVQEE
jgi:hypothetical protein